MAGGVKSGGAGTGTLGPTSSRTRRNRSSARRVLLRVLHRAGGRIRAGERQRAVAHTSRQLRHVLLDDGRLLDSGLTDAYGRRHRPL
jgi:hypothetical protein